MTEETVQDAPAEAVPPAPEQAAPVAAAPRRRRAPKQDPLLVADVATARAGVEQIAEPSQIGAGHRVTVEEDRLVVHHFECALPGYRGWNWFASLARAPRSKAVTVCEVGLLPGEDALLAPEWVPWSARVSAEEKAQEEQDRAEDEAGENAAADGPEGSGGAPDGEPASGDWAEDRPVPPQEGEGL
ncbi:DUF3027 domain-containing protein [Kocuria sp. CPCC 205263]|uniref:DUF3027 domain-containing protein n=1 Tax=Kocuria sp. CPCC 205263 TaxID=3073555 RepID=UPI0034D5BD09